MHLDLSESGVRLGALLLGTILLSLSPARLEAQSGMLNKNGPEMTCASDDGRRHYCPVNTSRGVRLVNQRSQTPCREGYSWGYDRRGVWVGCEKLVHDPRSIRPLLLALALAETGNQGGGTASPAGSPARGFLRGVPEAASSGQGIGQA